MSKRILHIRQSIKKAKKLEKKQNNLQPFVQSKLDNLSLLIKLPKDSPEIKIAEFVVNYIEHVPEVIEALTALSKKSGLYEYTQTFLSIAEDYFISPPEVIKEHTGMQALIDEAYLAHRLIEEINDRLNSTFGSPLAPIDMTLSNLIVHEILGDDFANKLDHVVLYVVEMLFQSDSFTHSEALEKFIAQHKKHGWDKELKKWPCLAGDKSMTLKLESNPIPSALH